MYRILLVDDELAVLNGLCKTIPWAEYGFETVAQASNGVQALSMLQQQQFDILLTDISMPDMDGLTLLKTARVLYPDMRCIILTAYSEFDYVLQALRLGVDNFLLKPLNPAELISTIQQSLKRIESPFISADESTGTFRCNILTRWMTGTLSVEELDSHAESAGINLFCRNYNIVSLKPLTGSIETKATCETLLKALAAYFDCYTVTDEYNCTFFILGGHSITTDNLYPLLKPFVRDNFHIFIGQTVDNCSLLSACYQELQQTTLYAAMFSTDEPVCIDTLRQKTAQFKGSGYLGSLPDLLHNLKQPDISTQFSHLLYDFLEHITPSEYIFAVIAYLDILLVKLKQSHLSQELLTDFLTATVETLLPLNNKKRLSEQLFHIFEETQHLINTEFEHVSPIIQRVIQFLKENYQSPVSLKTLAHQLSVNASYLGYLFKDETGIYFSDYLNSLRMQHAENLLLQTDYTINEIAELTGYSTTAYFNQIFKKSHAMPPAKYRQTNKNIR